jgi:hypothetical protein
MMGIEEHWCFGAFEGDFFNCFGDGVVLSCIRTLGIEQD